MIVLNNLKILIHLKFKPKIQTNSFCIIIYYLSTLNVVKYVVKDNHFYLMVVQ